jgi:hypothetical protein
MMKRRTTPGVHDPDAEYYVLTMNRGKRLELPDKPGWSLTPLQAALFVLLAGLGLVGMGLALYHVIRP